MAIVQGELFTQYPTSVPSHFGSSFMLDGYYHDSRSEFIIRKEELQALGISAGMDIKELAFMMELGGGLMDAYFYIALKHTSLTSMPTLGNTPPYSQSTQVYFHSQHQIVQGWNNFVFDTPFTWDGSSNIMVTMIKDRTFYEQNNSVMTRDTGIQAIYKGYMSDSVDSFPFDGLMYSAGEFTTLPRTYIVAQSNIVTTVAPEVPTNVTPVDKYSSDNSTVTFTGTLVDNELFEDPIRLVIERSTSSDFTGIVSVESSMTASGGVGSVSMKFPSNGTYYWRAKAVDSGGLSSNYTETRTIAITNKAPFLSNITPANNTVVTDTITIGATATDPEGSNVEIFYEVYKDLGMTNLLTSNRLATSGLFSMPSGSSATGTVYNIVATNTNVYWRIRARDDEGNYSSWTTLRGVYSDAPVTERLPLDTVISQTNLTGATVANLDEYPGIQSSDENWATATSNTTAMNIRVGFPTPSRLLKTGTGLQTFKAIVRRSNTSSTSNPTITLAVYENGVSKATTTAVVNNSTSQTLVFTWDASILTDKSGAGVEFYLSCPVAGSGGSRTTASVGAMGWDCMIDSPPQVLAPNDVAPLNVTSLANDSTDSTVTLTWNEPTDSDLDRYEVYRDNVIIASYHRGAIYTDKNLNASTSYVYKVVSVDAVGNKSSGVTTTATTKSGSVTKPVVTIVSIDKLKISNQTGIDRAVVRFKFDVDVIQWTVNVMGADHLTGRVADYGGSVTAGTEITATIDFSELYQEGANRVNIYGQSSGGWTPYAG